MNNISEVLEGVKTLGIAGHVRPDGDCVGSCMALYQYMRRNFPQIETDIYLEDHSEVFHYIKRLDEVKKTPVEGKVYDLFITCDASSRDRVAIAGELFDSASRRICIDHHVSNTGFGDINHVLGTVSSACEVLYGLMDEDKIDKDIATSLFTGMITDTGVFQYPSTSPDTYRTAAALIEKGVEFSRIIEEAFYQKTYVQNQVMGRVLAESIMLFDGKCIVGFLKKKDMDFYGVTGKDMEGIVSQLRLTTGTEAAIFLYASGTEQYKVSMRSNGRADVSRIACYFGGGGHVLAAGCTMEGSVYDVINNITEQLDIQFRELGIL